MSSKCGTRLLPEDTHCLGIQGHVDGLLNKLSSLSNTNPLQKQLFGNQFANEILICQSPAAERITFSSCSNVTLSTPNTNTQTMPLTKQQGPEAHHTLIRRASFANSGLVSMYFFKSKSRYSKTRYNRFSLCTTSCNLCKKL